MTELLLKLSRSIIRSAVLLLIILFVIAGFSLFSIIKIGDELESITQEDIPLMASIILITEHQLEQAIHVERAMLFGEIISHNPEMLDDFTAAIAGFNKYGKLVNAEIKTSEKQITKTLKDTISAAVKLKFATIKQALENIEKEHADFEDHAKIMFKLLSTDGLTSEIRELAIQLEHEEDQLDQEIEFLLNDIAEFTHKASITVKQHEAIILLILASICFISLVFVVAGAWYLKKTIPSLLTQIEYLASYDALTDLLNRREFFATTNKYLQLAKRENQVFSLLLLDLDNFKLINDRYGHAAGDEVLESFAKTIRHTLRESDFIGRIGGEEFAILLPNTKIDTASPLIQNIHTAIRESVIQYNGETITYTISMGLVMSSETTGSIEKLLDKADKALYFTKENGRNCTAIHQDKVVDSALPNYQLICQQA